eukprot:SAG11_NODE_7941_length_1079_cov_1.098980_4_plen_39_part_01
MVPRHNCSAVQRVPATTDRKQLPLPGYLDSEVWSELVLE